MIIYNEVKILDYQRRAKAEQHIIQHKYFGLPPYSL